MPLHDGYAVLIGHVERHYIDPPDDEGRWPHYHIRVRSSSGEIYDSAINLKSRSRIQVEYRDFRKLNLSYFDNILHKNDGLHQLSSNSESGALDFVRHMGLQDPFCNNQNGKNEHSSSDTPTQRCNCTQWWLENGINTVKLMQFYLDGVKRVYIFGEPYSNANGRGIHNVHMTQGDPIDSEYADEDGIWQDGGVMFEYSDPQPHLSILMTKFETQSLTTDNNGQPT